MHASYTFVVHGEFHGNETLRCVRNVLSKSPTGSTSNILLESRLPTRGRQAWQRHKLQIDPDHRDNKSRAQQTWTQKNPDYWRQYRESHPEYVKRNRSMQRERNATRERQTIAKKDASIAEFPPPPGVYRIRLVAPGEIAKTDVCTIEITTHTCECTSPDTIAKIGRDP